ncbi:MFS transporter [Pseudomonas purpurea]|uniref:MFS transporter n=1 Tax=Pseudomonas purpurea TaxID=3136737 RepID=UPI0032647A22
MNTVIWLDFARAVQGLAAAASLASGSAALAHAFDGHERTRAFGALGTTFGIGLALGPLVAGALGEYWGWQAIFLSTALITGVSFCFAACTLQESRDQAAGKLDVAGLISFSATLAGFTSAVILGPSYGWNSPLIVALFMLSLVGGLIFVAVELHTPRPMLSLGLFRYPRFVGVQLLPVGTCYCYIVLIVVLPIRLIGVEGASAWHAGWIMLALSSPMLVVPLLATSLTRWVSAGGLCAGGFLIAATGLYALSLSSISHGWAELIALLVIGTGTALPWGLMDGLSISVVPTNRAGMATGIFNTTRVAGEGIALAITMTLLVELTSHALRLRIPELQESEQVTSIAQHLVTGDLRYASAFPLHAVRQASNDAFRVLLQMLASFTLMTAIAVAVFLRRPAQVYTPSPVSGS